MERSMSRGGFTLVEIMVVVIVLGLLAGLVAPQIMGRVSDARTATAKAQVELIATALDSYRLDNGVYPTSAQGLEALRRPPQGGEARNWRGPYLRKEVPLDPWDRPYLYRSPGEHDTWGYDLASWGRDGQPGGTGDDADVVSWE